jgi:drug/metabolite transporter (DMT)-like permease
VSRSADTAGVGAFAFVFWRGAIGTLAMLGLLYLVVRRRGAAWPDPRRLVPRQRVLLLVASLCGALLNICIFLAFLRTEIAVVLITFYTFPALVTLAAVRFYGERLDRVRVGALILASGGLALVLLGPLLETHRLELDPIGVGLAFVAALCQVVFLLINGRGFAPFSAFDVSAWVIAVAAMVALPLALVGGQAADLVTPLVDSAALPWVLLAGVVGAALPTIALLTGIGRIGPSRAAILMTIEPVVGVALAALLLAEQPVPLQLVGGAAVLAAAVVLQAMPRAGALAVAEAEDEYQQLV